MFKAKAMKTKFSFIAFLTLLIVSLSVHANQSFIDIWKRYFLKANEISVVNGIRSSYFEPPKFAAGPNSVPRYSENYSWNSDIYDWQHTSNSTYSFDEDGRITEESYKFTQHDLYQMRFTYAYDYFGNVTEDVSYTKVNDKWELLTGKKSEYLYNVNGEIIGVIEQTVENKAWVNKTKTEYTLNSFSVPVSMQTFNWNKTGWELYSKTTDITWKNWQKRELAAYTLMLWQNDTWVNSERYTTQFDGDINLSTTELWVDAEWVNSSRETYSGTQFYEEFILENWTESGWEKIKKFKGTYDICGNLTGLFYSTWDKNEWISKLELLYDLFFNQSNDVTQMVYRHKDQFLLAPKIVAKYRYSNFLYFGTTDVKDVNVLENVMVFPNPVTSSLNIRIDDTNTTEFNVNITNLAGQTIFTKNYSSPTISVNTEGFTKGMYLLNLKSSDGKIYNGKILKN